MHLSERECVHENDASAAGQRDVAVVVAECHITPLEIIARNIQHVIVSAHQGKECKNT
jgi:hypothetical protein